MKIEKIKNTKCDFHDCSASAIVVLDLGGGKKLFLCRAGMSDLKEALDKYNE